MSERTSTARVSNGQALPIDSSRTWHRADCETWRSTSPPPRRGAGRRLASQQLRRHFGQFGARCLVDREHVLHRKPDTARAAQASRRLQAPQICEGTALRRQRLRRAGRNGMGEHHVTALATLDAPAESRQVLNPAT